MKRRELRAASWILAAGVSTAGICLSGSVLAQTWTITTLDAAGDVGRCADFFIATDGHLHVVYLRNDDHTLKEISKEGVTWSAPAVVDNSGVVGGSCALWLDPSDRIKAAYRRTDIGAAVYAGPEGVRTWSLQPVAQTDDVGRGLSMLQQPNGDFGLAYRDQTTGALHHLKRETGVWGTPVVVDPGPNRGQYIDLAYSPGDGYAFCEYDPTNGAQLIAHTRLIPPSFTVQAATSQADNVGLGLSLLQDGDGSFTAAFRNQTRGSLQYIRRESGVWTSPVTVDEGPNRGQCLDVARRAGVGLAFCEYDAANGAQILADQVLHPRTWAMSMVTSSEDNVGTELSLLMSPDGSMAASFRNATTGSLHMIQREAGGWAAPLTVDGLGGNRGRNADIARDPGGAYCFSEYDGDLGAAYLAHTTLRGRTLDKGTLDAGVNAGRQLSLLTRENGRIDCAYLIEETGGRLKLKVAEIVPDYAFIVRTVADSVSMTNTGAVTPDLSVTPDLRWCVSYRKVGPNDLYMASTDNFQLLPADAEEPDTPSGSQPVAAGLAGSYPNPALRGFRVVFTSVEVCEARFLLCDVAGRALRDEVIEAGRGRNTFHFDGNDAFGRPLAPGTYFMKLYIAGREAGTRRIVLLRPGP